MRKHLLFVAVTVTLAGCSDNNASTTTPSHGSDLPVLQTLERQGLEIHGPLEAPGGLNAFAARAGTRAVAVYIMPDTDYALLGTLIDTQGKPVVEEALHEIVSEPLEQGAWDSLAAAGWVADGDADAERIVYAFTDANCPFCHELWMAARPWVEAGKVQLRHVMVGVIRADSAAKAANILQADDPEAALTFNEINHARGGIKPLDTLSGDSKTVLDSNLALMQQLGFGGTPGIIARGEDGQLSFQSGVPRGSALEDLFGKLE